jgi:hypothetical protein
MLLPPRPDAGFGVYLVGTEFGGLGGLVTWRPVSNRWGLRFGLAEDADDLGIFGGIDFGGGVHRQTSDLPLDIDWLAGGFLSVGDNVLISVPLGLTGGHTFYTQGASFTPFVAPRLVLDLFFFEDPDTNDNDSDVDVDLAADVGVDMRLSGFRPVIRFAGSLGREAIAIGLVFGPSGAQRRASRD